MVAKKTMSSQINEYQIIVSNALTEGFEINKSMHSLSDWNCHTLDKNIRIL